ncbi:MAG: hypothetical protein GY804_08985 [Alphaproteobacteria bacterium]|nr:hypothetical protein [Alphaproteobacteria bacterium]
MAEYDEAELALNQKEISLDIASGRDRINVLSGTQKEKIQQYYHDIRSVEKTIDYIKGNLNEHDQKNVLNRALLQKVEQQQSNLKQTIILNHINGLLTLKCSVKGDPSKYYPVWLHGSPKKTIKFSIFSEGDQGESHLKCTLMGMCSDKGYSNINILRHFYTSDPHIINISSEMYKSPTESSKCFQGFYVKGGTTYSVATYHHDIFGQLTSCLLKPIKEEYLVGLNGCKDVFYPI